MHVPELRLSSIPHQKKTTNHLPYYHLDVFHCNRRYHTLDATSIVIVVFGPVKVGRNVLSTYIQEKIRNVLQVPGCGSPSPSGHYACTLVPFRLFLKRQVLNHPEYKRYHPIRRYSAPIIVLLSIQAPVCQDPEILVVLFHRLHLVRLPLHDHYSSGLSTPFTRSCQ